MKNDYFNEKDELVCSRCSMVVDVNDGTCGCAFILNGDTGQFEVEGSNETISPEDLQDRVQKQKVKNTAS